MRYLIPFAFVACTVLPTFAETPQIDGWSCRNHDAEIRCSGDTCEIEQEAFTPMDITLSDTMISACAYSGCWDGTPTSVTQTGRFATYVGEQLEWTGSYESTGDISVTVDFKEQVGTIIVRSLYAMPLTCEPYADPPAED